MLVARQPLQPLSTSSGQTSQRRISSCLLEKNDAPPVSTTRNQVNGNAEVSCDPPQSARPHASKPENEKKRKMNDDGFIFTRVKRNKPEPKQTVQSQPAPQPQIDALAPHRRSEPVPQKEADPKPATRKRRKKLSFSSPNPPDDPPVRRSRRLSRENVDRGGSPVPAATTKSKQKCEDVVSSELPKLSPQKRDAKSPSRAVQKETKPRTHSKKVAKSPLLPKSKPQSVVQNLPTQPEDHVATKIALPFADTPVIKRNKAMGEGESGKGERRSRLRLRGRRASSLIETGNSNALPYNEVEIPDFYKHIESQGLPEPRRMRQLLTWCASRVLDEKPMGTDFEDSSARSAARVIQEELLQDLSNRSDLSDWFSREDAPVQKKPLPERANPKNIQNMKKISELEEQVKRLKLGKEGLESLLRPPNIPKSGDPSIVKELLPESDIAALESLKDNLISSDQLSRRLNGMFESVGPTIDLFAGGIHRIGQYRNAADNIAGRVLSICAERLAESEKEGRKKALPSGHNTPPKDLSGVLRSLSRADR